MAIKRHDLIIDKEIIRHIDYTLPKLKYSVNFRKVIRWLENFEKEDVNLAIDFSPFKFKIETKDTMPIEPPKKDTKTEIIAKKNVDSTPIS